MRTTLFGTVMVLALTMGIIVPVFGATVPAMNNPSTSHRPAPVFAAGTTLTFTGSGTAFKINNSTLTASASFSLTAKVDRSSPGRGMLNFTGGSLTIGSDTYNLVTGHGMINYHSHRVTLHLTVKNSAGDSVHLILNGKYSMNGANFTVDFFMPQSKLASHSFLKFQGATITTS